MLGGLRDFGFFSLLSFSLLPASLLLSSLLGLFLAILKVTSRRTWKTKKEMEKGSRGTSENGWRASINCGF